MEIFTKSLVSYFPRANGCHDPRRSDSITPHTLTEAMGRELPTWEIMQCFNCHATKASTGEKLSLDKLTPGLDCERCHVGAEQHMADAAHDDFKTLPKSLKVSMPRRTLRTSAASATAPGTR